MGKCFPAINKNNRRMKARCKILVANNPSLGNRGNEALLKGLFNILKLLSFDFNVTVFLRDIESDKDAIERFTSYSQNQIRFISDMAYSHKFLLFSLRNILYLVIRKYMGLRINFLKLIDDHILREFKKADIVISLGGDVFTLDYGWSSLIWHLWQLYLGFHFKKPVFILGQSFNTELLDRFTYKQVIKYFIKRSEYTTVRESYSLEILRKIDLGKNVSLTADLSFFLEPAGKERVKKIKKEEGLVNMRKPVIGFNVSQGICRFSGIKREVYISTFIKVIEEVTLNFGGTAIIIPHVYIKSSDDRLMAVEIYNRIPVKSNVFLLENTYFTEELKGIIGELDLMIASRGHAMIAALDMGIPTISIFYSTKGPGIIKDMLGDIRYSLHINDLNEDKLFYLIKMALGNSNTIRKNLRLSSSDARKRCFRNAELIIKCLAKKDKHIVISPKSKKKALLKRKLLDGQQT